MISGLVRMLHVWRYGLLSSSNSMFGAFEDFECVSVNRWRPLRFIPRQWRNIVLDPSLRRHAALARHISMVLQQVPVVLEPLPPIIQIFVLRVLFPAKRASMD